MRFPLTFAYGLLLLGSYSVFAEDGPNVGGGGSSRADVLLDTYVRENTIGRDEGEFRDCMIPNLKALGEALPDYADRLRQQVKSKRFVLVPEATLAKVAVRTKDYLHVMGERLVAVHPDDSPFVWVSEEFYRSPKMNKSRKCDLIRHELVVGDYLKSTHRNNRQLTDKEKDKILQASVVLADYFENPDSETAASLQEKLIGSLGLLAGRTPEQKVKSQLGVLNFSKLYDTHAANYCRSLSYVKSWQFAPYGDLVQRFDDQTLPLEQQIEQVEYFKFLESIGWARKVATPDPGSYLASDGNLYALVPDAISDCPAVAEETKVKKTTGFWDWFKSQPSGTQSAE